MIIQIWHVSAPFFWVWAGPSWQRWLLIFRFPDGGHIGQSVLGRCGGES